MARPLKAFTKAYDYIHPANGDRYSGLIEADSRAELEGQMQAELDASGGALTPANFTSPGVQLVVRVETALEAVNRKLAEANARLKAAGVPEVLLTKLDDEEMK